jgi:hypothetical protein
MPTRENPPRAPSPCVNREAAAPILTVVVGGGGLVSTIVPRRHKIEERNDAKHDKNAISGYFRKSGAKDEITVMTAEVDGGWLAQIGRRVCAG